MLNNDEIPHSVPVSNLAGQAQHVKSPGNDGLNVRRRASGCRVLDPSIHADRAGRRISSFRFRCDQGQAQQKKLAAHDFRCSFSVCVCVRVTTRAASRNIRLRTAAPGYFKAGS